MRLRIWPYLPQWSDLLEIAILSDQPRDENYVRRVLHPLQYEDFQGIGEGYEMPRAGTMTLENAQELMDALWSCGLRPSQGRGSAGAMDAVQEHLKDLRQNAEDMKLIVQRLLQIGGGDAAQRRG